MYHCGQCPPFSPASHGLTTALPQRLVRSRFSARWTAEGCGPTNGVPVKRGTLEESVPLLMLLVIFRKLRAPPGSHPSGKADLRRQSIYPPHDLKERPRNTASSKTWNPAGSRLSFRHQRVSRLKSGFMRKRPADQAFERDVLKKSEGKSGQKSEYEQKIIFSSSFHERPGLHCIPLRIKEEWG